MKCWSWQYTIGLDLALMCTRTSFPCLLKHLFYISGSIVYTRRTTYKITLTHEAPSQCFSILTGLNNRLGDYGKSQSPGFTLDQLKLESLKQIPGPKYATVAIHYQALPEGNWEAKKKIFQHKQGPGSLSLRFKVLWSQKERIQMRLRNVVFLCVWASGIWVLEGVSHVLKIHNTSAHTVKREGGRLNSPGLPQLVSPSQPSGLRGTWAPGLSCILQPHSTAELSLVTLYHSWGEPEEDGR